MRSWSNTKQIPSRKQKRQANWTSAPGWLEELQSSFTFGSQAFGTKLVIELVLMQNACRTCDMG